MKTLPYYLILLTLTVLFSCGGNKDQNRWFGGDTTEEEDTEGGFNYSRREASQYLQQWIDSTGLQTNLPKIEEDSAMAANLYDFYQQRSFKPAWQKNHAEELASLLESIDQEGLDPESFPLDSIEALVNKSAAEEETDAYTGARMDLLLSASYLKLASIMTYGKVKPGDYYNSWHIKPAETDTLSAVLARAATQGQVQESMQQLRPQHPQYQALQQKLKQYQQAVDKGGWPTIEAGPELEPGDSSQRIVNIRTRLYASGDLRTPPEQWQQPTFYDSGLVAAVNAYQQRNGLEAQPTITEAMVSAMNVSAEMRLRQIMLNMDRIRWFSSGELAKTYVLVNVPEYRMRVIENDRQIKNMKVVVGAQMNSTPIFSDSIDYIDFSPYWNVPTSIAMEEIVPKVRNNPGYLAKNHYEIVPANATDDDQTTLSPSEVDWDDTLSYRIRQKPGPWNALGSVKFIFPNDFAIYLHDTPEEHLFDRTERAFSHGCIRIEDPAWFADWLLPQLSLQEVKEKMNNEKREVVKLEQKIPVYIFYLTAFVDEQGNLNFREDLYQLDERLAEQFAMN
jgi:murein L,D-transpeptidase YcbB/YkuD